MKLEDDFPFLKINVIKMSTLPTEMNEHLHKLKEVVYYTLLK